MSSSIDADARAAAREELERLPTVRCRASEGCGRRAPAPALRARPEAWSQFPEALRARLRETCARCFQGALRGWLAEAGRRVCNQRSCLRLLPESDARASCGVCLAAQRARQRWAPGRTDPCRDAPPTKCAHCSSRLSEEERARVSRAGRWLRKCERCLLGARQVDARRRALRRADGRAAGACGS